MYFWYILLHLVVAAFDYEFMEKYLVEGCFRKMLNFIASVAAAESGDAMVSATTSAAAARAQRIDLLCDAN